MLEVPLDQLSVATTQVVEVIFLVLVFFTLKAAMLAVAMLAAVAVPAGLAADHPPMLEVAAVLALVVILETVAVAAPALRVLTGPVVEPVVVEAVVEPVGVVAVVAE